jgi:hypothetical protein
MDARIDTAGRNGAPGPLEVERWIQAENRTTSWRPVDLRRYLDGSGVEPPSMLARSDGKKLLYPARIHAEYGEPESGKGWLAHLAAHERIQKREHVLYVDFEDDPATAVERQLALGTRRHRLVRYFHYIQPEASLVAWAFDDLDAVLRDHDVKLAILDGMTEAFAQNDLDVNANVDVAKWLQLLPRPLAGIGITVLQIDHVTKKREGRSRYAIGAQHKLAGGAVSYSLDVVDPFDRETPGEVKIICEKDRHGFIGGGGREVARMLVTPVEDERVDVGLDPPSPEGEAPAESNEQIKERVSEYVAKHPGLSKRTIMSEVKGNKDGIAAAIDLLLAEDYLKFERGENNAHKHYSMKPYGGDE